MIYCVRLYTVDVTRVPVFLAAFHPRGGWNQMARHQPGYVHLDLLRNPADSCKFMSIEFWTSIEALLTARRSPEVCSFARWLRRLAIDSEGLGMFLFPPLPSTGESAPDELTCAPASLIGEHALATENQVRP